MARRRLTLAPLIEVPRAEPPRAEPLSFPAAPIAAPIAAVVADAAGAAAFADLSASVARARETGRLVLDLPLDAIAPDHLSRDRLPAEDEEMKRLRDSIRAHGQRTPIEVTPIAGALPYGLISGWRRLTALKALHAETGEARFATVQALVRRPETVADAYVTMVEENEIRVGLSQYERARVAALAAARGVFASEEAALGALFATASKAKRSRIRSFLAVYHALDGVLRYPAHLPERLGLALEQRLRDGGRDSIAAALAAADHATPEAELATLAGLVAAGRPRPAPAPLLPGVTLESRLTGRTLTLRLQGEGVTPALAEEIRALLGRLPASR
jgi:ParB-like chromosome segregation protein Spo0J